MILTGIIFILSLLLLCFGVDFSSANLNLEYSKFGAFAAILLSSFFIFVSQWREKKYKEKIKQKISLLCDEFLGKNVPNSSFERLELLRETYEKKEHALKKFTFEQENYFELCNELLHQLENVKTALYHLENESDKELLALILANLKKQKEKIIITLNTPLVYNKDINKALDETLHFKASVAIVGDDDLENFLIQILLAQYGIQSQFFKELSFSHNDFHLIFIKDSIFNAQKKVPFDCIVFGYKERKIYPSFLALPIEKRALEFLLKEKLEGRNLRVLANSCPYNVLLFKDNHFESSLFFSIIEKQCGQNFLIHSLSELKQNLEKHSYRLVLLDYEVIKFDLEQMKIFLNRYKKRNPQSHIVLFTKNKEKIVNFDCLSEIFKDISKNELVLLLRKYLNLNAE